MAETATRKTIREACADTLGLLLQVLVTIKVDADTYTIPALADVSPDPERMRDSFLYDSAGAEFRRILLFGYPTNNNVDISRAFTYSAGTTTAISDTSLTDTAQNWVVNALIGRVLTCNTKTMTITANTATVATGTGWSGGGNPGTPQAYTLSLLTAQQIYFMLSPDEWNSIINETLPDYYYIDRIAVTPITNTTEYSLATATWLQTKGQIIDVFFENITTKIPEPVGSYEFTETANVLKLILHCSPPDAATYNIVVEARHNYAALATDATTTTCPYELWFNAVQVGGLHRIYKKYGSNIKRLFGQAVMIAERELANAKSKVLPPLTPRNLHMDVAWSGPDFDFLPEDASW
jgi:hypothetical protein